VYSVGGAWRRLLHSLGRRADRTPRPHEHMHIQFLPALPETVIAVLVQRVVAWRTWQWRPSVSTASTHYSSGTSIPECNGLSQFREDTGEPSIPV